MYRNVVAAVTLSYTLFAAACSSPSSAATSAASPTPVSTAAVRSLHVVGPPNSYIVVGDTAQFTAIATMSTGASVNVTDGAQWTSQ